MINDCMVLLSANTMLVFEHQGQHKYRSDGITRSVGIMPREPCPLTNIHPNIHVPGQTLAINSNRAPRMRSICPLSVCSSGEYVYVTAEPISLPFLCSPHSPIIPVPIYPPAISTANLLLYAIPVEIADSEVLFPSICQASHQDRLGRNI